MKIRSLFQIVVVFNLVLAALPMQAVQAALAEPATPENLLQFASGGHVLGFAGGGMYAATGTHSLHVDFVAANRIRPQSDSPASAQGQAAALSRVTYAGLWDGIDLVYSSGAEGIYTTTYILAPGADPEDILLQYNAPLALNEDGTLTITFETGAMSENAPLAWQEIGGERLPVDASFRVTGREVGFILGDYDPEYTLTIDPSLVWNSFLGGFGNDTGEAIVVDADGNVFIAGSAATSWGIPVRAYTGGEWDGYAAKLDSSGNPVWNTYLGGAGADNALGIAVDSSGYVYVAGMSSLGWGSPVRGYSGGMDAYVVRLDSDGALTWSTFLGGSGYDAAYDLAIEGTGNLYVTGYSGAAWGSPVRAFSGGDDDAFAAKLNPLTGSLTWNTFLGGSGLDIGNGVGRDFAGNVYITGSSDAAWGAPVNAYAGGADAFAVKLDASTGALTWNTFLGGSGDDVGFAVASATNGSNIYVSGDSYAAWGSPVRAYTGGVDAFAAKLDSTGALTWNTFLGGSDEDTGHGIAVDGFGYVYVAGDSQASWGSPVRAFNDVEDAFAVKLTSSGSISWNTFLGGSRSDTGAGIAVLFTGTIYVCGASMATWGSPVQALTSGDDALVAALDDDSGALLWNTFAGGSGDDFGYSIDVDADGNIYVAGYSTASWGYPYLSYTSGEDAFAAKLDSDGNPLWNTFLGGNGDDRGYGITVNADGIVHVSGYSTEGWGSPIRAYAGGWDAFAVELDSSGNLVWLTFLGGSDDDQAEGIDEDLSGNLYVAGISNTTWGTPIRAFSGAWDAFAAKLDSDGNLVWNTFLGGGDGDYAAGVAVSWNGNVYVTGSSQSTWGSPVRGYTGGYDAFVANLSSSTGGLTWNTFLGGSGEEMATDIAVDAFGNAYATGYADATWGSPLRAYAGGEDAYAAKLDANGNLSWHVFLGQGGNDFGDGIGADMDGNVYVSGSSNGSWGDPLRGYTGNGDAFVAKLDSAGDLAVHTFLGGDGNDFANSVSLDGNGNVLAAGSSNELWGTPANWFNDGYEAFVAKVNLNPPGPFMKTGPADGAYVTIHPTLAWNASGGADEYEYCYDTSDNNICDDSWLSVGDALIVGLGVVSAHTTYYWQVRAVNELGTVTADGGTWWSFTALPQSFADVPTSYWAWSYIERLFAAGITGGCATSPLRYCPAQSVTRAQMAIFLERGMNGSSYTPPPATGTVFGDVSISYWAAAWIEKLYADGITGGCGGGNYCPDRAVTRAEMAIFLLRAEHGSSYTPPAATGTVFGDVPISHWAAAWIEQLSAEGITGGCGGGNYCPNQAATRAEMAVFLVRTFGLP